MTSEDAILVKTSDDVSMRGLGSRELKIEELSVSVNLFLGQMETILERAPTTVGRFHFAEFEVHAEVSAKGQLVLLGTGGEAGATGGIKFVFRRTQSTETGSNP
jgi:hypothetical protein